MAKRQPIRTQPRVIPNFNLAKPANDPSGDTEQDQEGLAQSAVLSGAGGLSGTPTNTQVTTLLNEFQNGVSFLPGLGSTFI